MMNLSPRKDVEREVGIDHTDHTDNTDHIDDTYDTDHVSEV